MKIILDVMSGDNAPLELIKGAVDAAKEYHVNISIVGDESVIRSISLEHKLDISSLDIVHAGNVITMEDAPLSVVRGKTDSSMSIGLHMLANGEGDAFVSAGNTGALLAGATLIVRRIKGVHRAGIASVLPLANPVLLMDSGANLEVTPQDLEQFAFMGAKYMERILGVSDPRVGLLNNGTEPTKGLELQREAFRQLSHSDVNFVGNVEGKEIPQGVCDVVVTDGFTGNILLKTVEGMGKFMSKTLTSMFKKGIGSILAYLLLKKEVKALKRRMNASEYGGAPFLGISKPVIKAHGSSDALAIKNAIRQAIRFTESELNREIALYAIDFDARMKERKRALTEAEKAQAREERLAKKRKPND